MKKTLLTIFLIFCCSEPVKIIEIEPVGMAVEWVKVNSEPITGGDGGWWLGLYINEGVMSMVTPLTNEIGPYYEVVFYGDTLLVYDFYPCESITHFVELEYFEFQCGGKISVTNGDEYEIFEYHYK